MHTARAAGAAQQQYELVHDEQVRDVLICIFGFPKNNVLGLLLGCFFGGRVRMYTAGGAGAAQQQYEFDTTPALCM